MRVRDDSKTALIYKATLDLVKERGLAGITMGDISRAACIATGTLYIYFKNKEELIKALFLQCREQSALHYFAGIEKTDLFEEKMRQIFTNITRYKIAFYEVAVFLEQSCHSPFVCITDVKKKQKGLQPLLDLISEGIETKKIKDADNELILSYMFGIINEMVKKTYFSRKKISPETIEQLYAMFWDGVRR